VVPAPTRPAGGSQTRADRTRTAIVEETVRCVLEEGFPAASAKHVAERAGVTWGVVQYHFGGPAGIFAAVVRAGYDDTVARLDAVEVAGDSTRARVQSVVDAAWAAFSSPLARAGFEILVATRPHREPADDDRLADIGRRFHRLGALLAPDRPDVGDLMFSALRGLALNQMMLVRELDSSRERALLVDVLTQYLDTQHLDPDRSRS
jgi:TetR/AcrR family transcriptional regulator, regulator of cefoperazone and chloramphenicol sensitivity